MSDGTRGVGRGPLSIHADVAPPEESSPERMPTLGQKLAMHDVRLVVGDKTYAGQQIARMSESELAVLAHRAGLDPGRDAFEYLWCLAIEANHGRVIDLGAPSDLAVEMRVKNGKPGDFLLHEALAPKPRPPRQYPDWLSKWVEALPSTHAVDRDARIRAAALLLTPRGPALVAERSPDSTPAGKKRWLDTWHTSTRLEQGLVQALVAKAPSRRDLVLELCASWGYKSLQKFFETAERQHVDPAEQLRLLDKVAKSTNKAAALGLALRIIQADAEAVRTSYLEFLETGTPGQLAFLNDLRARGEAEQHALAWIGQHRDLDPDWTRDLGRVWPNDWTTAAGWLPTLQRLESAGRLADTYSLVVGIHVDPEGVRDVLAHPWVIVDAIDMRQVTFHYTSHGKTFELRGRGAHAPEKGTLSLAHILMTADPRAELRRYFPELDPNLLLTKFHFVPRVEAAKRVTFDISPGGAFDLQHKAHDRRLTLFAVRNGQEGREPPPVSRFATPEQVRAVSKNRILISLTGPTEVGIVTRGTAVFVEALQRTGRLGAALYHTARYTESARGNSFWALPTGVGDTMVIDSLPPRAVHALVVGSPDAYLPYGAAQTQEVSQALEDSGKLRDVTPHVARGAEDVRDEIVRLIDRTPTGEVAYVHILTHGSPSGVGFVDGSDLTISAFKALYERAEVQGVRLVVVNDSCYAGSVASAVGDVEARRLATLDPHGPLGVALRARDLLREAIEAMDKASTEHGQFDLPKRVTDVRITGAWVKRLPESTARGAKRPTSADPLATALGHLFDRPELEQLPSFRTLRSYVAAVHQRGRFWNHHERQMNQFDEIRLLDLMNDLVADLVKTANQANDPRDSSATGPQNRALTRSRASREIPSCAALSSSASSLVFPLPSSSLASWACPSP